MTIFNSSVCLGNRSVWKEPIKSWPDVKLPPQTNESEIELYLTSAVRSILPECVSCDFKPYLHGRLRLSMPTARSQDCSIYKYKECLDELHDSLHSASIAAKNRKISKKQFE